MVSRNLRNYSKHQSNQIAVIPISLGKTKYIDLLFALVLTQEKWISNWVTRIRSSFLIKMLTSPAGFRTLGSQKSLRAS